MTNKKKVLIVDDEKETCAVLEEFLGDAYEIAIANDGREALAKIDSFQPDCVLLDIRMPDLNGKKVLETLQTKESKPRVIVITGSLGSNAENEFQTLGAYSFMSKPIDLDDLEKKIESCLND